MTRYGTQHALASLARQLAVPPTILNAAAMYRYTGWNMDASDLFWHPASSC